MAEDQEHPELERDEHEQDPKKQRGNRGISGALDGRRSQKIEGRDQRTRYQVQQH
jgi:hypothetical protein